jgi:hypothetical protein
MLKSTTPAPTSGVSIVSGSTNSKKIRKNGQNQRNIPF